MATVQTDKKCSAESSYKVAKRGGKVYDKTASHLLCQRRDGLLMLQQLTALVLYLDRVSKITFTLTWRNFFTILIICVKDNLRDSQT